MLSHGPTPSSSSRTLFSHHDLLWLAMYKQTFPVPPLFTNESACFTAACSVLFPVFVLSLTYPTCSLYPLTSCSFLSVFVAWSLCFSLPPPLVSSHLGRFLAVPPPLFSQCLRKPSVLSVFLFFHRRLPLSQVSYFILSRSLFSTRFLLPGASHAKGPPCYRWHPTISRQSISIPYFVHISPRLIPPPSIVFSVFSLPLFIFSPCFCLSSVQFDLVLLSVFKTNTADTVFDLSYTYNLTGLSQAFSSV